MDTPCREFMGPRNTKGYGQKYSSHLRRGAGLHRWVVAQVLGWEAIEGRDVMHLCDNPPCFRFDHLRVGSRADNNHDRDRKGRGRNQNIDKTHCKNGHEFTPENTRLCEGERRRCRECDRAYQRNYYITHKET